MEKNVKYVCLHIAYVGMLENFLIPPLVDNELGAPFYLLNTVVNCKIMLKYDGQRDTYSCAPGVFTWSISVMFNACRCIE